MLTKGSCLNRAYVVGFTGNLCELKWICVTCFFIRFVLKWTETFVAHLETGTFTVTNQTYTQIHIMCEILMARHKDVFVCPYSVIEQCVCSASYIQAILYTRSKINAITQCPNDNRANWRIEANNK